MWYVEYVVEDRYRHTSADNVVSATKVVATKSSLAAAKIAARDYLRDDIAWKNRVQITIGKPLSVTAATMKVDPSHTISMAHSITREVVIRRVTRIRLV